MAILSKLPAAVAVAALTATLVGCGSSDVRDERDQALMERDATQAELDQTQTERDQAQAELEAAQAERDQAQMERMQAEEAAAAAEQARMEEEQARMEEEQARMEEEQARMEAEEAAAAAEQARMEAEAEQMRLAEEEAERKMMEMSATAKALLASLGDTDPDPAAANPLAAERRSLDEAATLADPDPDLYPVFERTLYKKVTFADVVADTFTRTMTTAAGDNVRATVSATSTGDVGVSVDGYSETETVPDMIDGYRGVELTSGTRTLWVYTDIEDATVGAGAARLDASYSSSSVAGKPRRYQVQVTPGTTGNIPWSDASRDVGGLVTTGVSTTATAVHEFMGSVKGVAGTFSCTGTAGNCSAPANHATTGVLGDTNGDGSVDFTDSTNAWYFTPDPLAMVDVMSDDGYLAFGWWLNKRGDDKPEAERMNVATFAQASGLHHRMGTNTVAANAADSGLAGQGGVLTGEAEYSGGAAGKYAVAEAATNNAHSGHFTAMANLKADFDADSDGNSLNGNDKRGIGISGTIDSFMTGDTARDWKVTLSYDENGTFATDVANTRTAVAEADRSLRVESPVMLGAELASDTTSGAVAKAEWDTGGAVKGSGSWTAKFYGGEKATDHPTAVVGTFGASIGSFARITGAFGANMDMDEDMADEEMGN